MKTSKKYFAVLGLASLMLFSCDKKERPGMSQYPVDTNPPGGPLNFYVAFDGTTDNPRLNAVDSIRANFAADNPLASTDGISGKAIQGENKKFVKYTKPNDWAVKSESFTISCWYKRDGQTQNNTGTNGPEYLMSFKADNGHWSGASLLFFLEGNNAGCAVKVMVADATNADSWFTWESSSDVIPGLLDNNWHHVAITYDKNNSTMVLYIDGAANSATRTWGTHGPVNIDNSTISEVRIGAGPGTNYDGDDWLSSTFKGSIDQVRMYSTALSASEVQSLFANRQ